MIDLEIVHFRLGWLIQLEIWGNLNFSYIVGEMRNISWITLTVYERVQINQVYFIS